MEPKWQAQNGGDMQSFWISLIEIFDTIKHCSFWTYSRGWNWEAGSYSGSPPFSGASFSQGQGGSAIYGHRHPMLSLLLFHFYMKLLEEVISLYGSYIISALLIHSCISLSLASKWCCQELLLECRGYGCLDREEQVSVQLPQDQIAVSLGPARSWGWGEIFHFWFSRCGISPLRASVQSVVLLES